jgi:hypothetical protein
VAPVLQQLQQLAAVSVALEAADQELRPQLAVQVVAVTVIMSA